MSERESRAPIIEVTHINKTYQSTEVATVAVEDISLSIQTGEFVSIMGKSGSGKSTLLHILGLLDRPTSGAYTLEGQDTTKLSEDRLALLRNEKLGFVFQSFHLLPRQTVLENVMLPLVYSNRSRSEHKSLAEEALAKTELSHRLGHFPTQLSGGEKQRVAIARALVNKPEIIFADEPTGNLDTKTGEAVMHTIDALHNEGHTVILITHETSTASFADRIIELRDGNVLRDQPNTRRHAQYHK